MDDKKDIPAAEKTPPPQETVQDLKAMREARGLSLQDIFEATRVSLVNLKALERGDFHSLPPPVYARDFIRKYARAAGVDEKPLLNRYEKHLESLSPSIQETEVQRPWPETGRRYRFLFGSLAAVIVAGILVCAFFLYDQGGKPASPTPVVESSSPERVMPVPAQTAAAPGVTVQPLAAAAGKMNHLVFEARELTWIRITEDRNPAYQVLLKPGDKIERMASDYFQLDIGNAGGLDLTFQGKSLGSLGRKGQIIHMRLPEKGSDRKAP
jgi:cytoskeleton protein RodZ